MKKYRVKIPVVVVLETQVFADDAEEAVAIASEEGLNFRVENDDNCNMYTGYIPYDEITCIDINDRDRSGNIDPETYTVTAEEIAEEQETNPEQIIFIVEIEDDFEDDYTSEQSWGRNRCPYCSDSPLDTGESGNCANCGGTVYD